MSYLNLTGRETFRPTAHQRMGQDSTKQRSSTIVRGRSARRITGSHSKPHLRHAVVTRDTASKSNSSGRLLAPARFLHIRAVSTCTRAIPLHNEQDSRLRCACGFLTTQAAGSFAYLLVILMEESRCSGPCLTGVKNGG
jgi:hypothetical protein